AEVGDLRQKSGTTNCTNGTNVGREEMLVLLFMIRVIRVIRGDLFLNQDVGRLKVAVHNPLSVGVVHGVGQRRNQPGGRPPRLGRRQPRRWSPAHPWRIGPASAGLRKRSWRVSGRVRTITRIAHETAACRTPATRTGRIICPASSSAARRAS